MNALEPRDPQTMDAYLAELRRRDRRARRVWIAITILWALALVTLIGVSLPHTSTSSEHGSLTDG